MGNLHISAIKDYETTTGKSYNDNAYTTPSSVPQDILTLVVRIKVYSAIERQLEIMSEIRKFLANGIAAIPTEKELLLREYDENRSLIETWEPFNTNR